MKGRLLKAVMAIVALLAATLIGSPASGAGQVGATRAKAPEVTWTAEIITAARQRARSLARIGGLTGKLEQAQADFLKRSRNHRRVSDVDTFELRPPRDQIHKFNPGSSVVMAVPRSVSLNQVRYADEPWGAAVRVDAVPARQTNSQGKAATTTSDTWDPEDGEDWIVYIYEFDEWIGKFHGIWQHQKLGNNNADAEWHGHRVSGQGIPNENLQNSPHFSDYEVAEMSLRSYPRTWNGIENSDWQDYEPQLDFEGDCDDDSVNFTVSFGGVGLEIPVSFADCDDYLVEHEPELPGDYYMKMSQIWSDGFLSDGDRFMEYATSIKIGKPDTYNGYSVTSYLRLIDQSRSPYPFDHDCWAWDTVHDSTCTVEGDTGRR